MKDRTSNPVMYDYTRRIRDFIGNTRRQYILLKNRELWHQLCSSLDVIEDSELAMNAYLAREVTGSDGAHYLAVYGVQQALLLQQDATSHLCEALKVPITFANYPRLRQIREMRHASTGHPTKKDRPKKQPKSYHAISRPTLGLGGFQLLSFHSDGRVEFNDIAIPELISDQKSCIAEILTSVISELERRDAAHKEKFRMEKLTKLFPETLGYNFQHVFEGTTRVEFGTSAFAQVGLQQIEKGLHDFREAPQKRGIELETYPSLKYTYGLLEYPLGELGAFFQSVKNEEKTRINQETAYIFAFFVKQQVDELRKIAQGIDEDYDR